jgi:outer membrane protein assembly factor BamB
LILKKKQTTFVIALILMLATSAFLVLAPSVNAITYSSYCFVVAFPNPVGVGQQITVATWLSEYPPFSFGFGPTVVFSGFRLVITKPDGTVEKMGPYDSDAMGAKYYTYSPTQTGTYKFQMTFDGQTFDPIYGGNTYKPSESAIATVTVQEEPVPYPSDGSLPTGYWQRPINDENRAWRAIAGNWILPGYDYYSRSFDGGSAFAPYTTAPTTAHILWTKPLTSGGLVGSPYGSDAYYQGSSYELKFVPPVIMDGVLYYNIYRPGQYPQGFTAVDVRTGKVLYTADDKGIFTTSTGGTLSYYGISFGQIFMFNSENQYGAFNYLWGTNGASYTMYDAFTGQPWLTFVNGSSGLTTIETGIPSETSGAILIYMLDTTNGWLARWNSTQAIFAAAATVPGFFSTGQAFYRPPFNGTFDWNLGIDMNVTIPTITPSVGIFGLAGASFLGQGGSDPYDGVLLASISYPPTDTSTTGWPTITHIGYDAKTGAELWRQNRTNLGLQSRGGHITPASNGVYCMYCAETMQWYGYSLKTGAQLWGPTEPSESSWSYYNTADNAAYGMLYGMGIDGIVRAFNITTGDLLWKWETGTSGYNTPYGNYPIYGGTVIADGKIYINEGTHGNGAGLWRGDTMSCVDAYTGELIWRVAGWFDGSTLAIADGYILAHNYYDNQIYSFGKGLSAVTVSSSPKVTSEGSSVVIEGTVTDQSPGQTCLGIPAAGTAAIADEDMSAWMEYLYMQKPMPTNATGVPVTLDVIDANGNYRNVGSTTSDSSGFYHFTWTPDIPGDYTVIATFAGSESYYASSSETAFTVTEAPPATPTPTPLTLPPYETYTIGAAIAVIIAIAIVGILLLRKRP